MQDIPTFRGLSDEKEIAKETEKEHPVSLEKNWKSEISQMSNKETGSREKECSIASNVAQTMDNIKTYK